nr:uncharacterized protein LOC117853357 [Setaria viridis]
MWLEKHLFCGRAAGPSSNTQALVEALSIGASVPLDSSTIDLADWIVAPFVVQQFKLWWAECKQHLFCASAAIYCNILDPNNIDPNAESESRVPPKRSRSGRPIEDRYPYTEFPLIGYHAPSVDDIAGGLKQTQKKIIKKTSRQVRARTESADPPVATSAESLAAPTLPVIEEVDLQAATEAGAAPRHCWWKPFRLHKPPRWIHSNQRCPKQKLKYRCFLLLCRLSQKSLKKPARAERRSSSNPLLPTSQSHQSSSRG